MIWAAETENRRSITAGWNGVLLLVLAATLHSFPVRAAEPAGDPARGARLFLQCRACHSVGATDPSGVGPNLWGVVGAKAAAKPGYHYSAGLSSSGIVWTPAMLDRWLTRPTAVVPDTVMAFQGVPSADLRRDIIAYLATLRAQSGGEGATSASRPATH